MSPRHLLLMASLVLTGCLSPDGEQIQRPADQGFGGGPHPGETLPALEHRVVAVGLAGTLDRSATVTLDGHADVDPAATSFSATEPADGTILPVDHGFDGARSEGQMTLTISDDLGNVRHERVTVVFNP